jgi:indolepyruvate ferredoxin oxidoreductase beta subunit
MNPMRQPLNFLLAGVGGQGTVLASRILAHVGLAAGYQVKQAEIHGMSQRGGSVMSQVRWGVRVYSPLISAGEVDVLLAFEKLEALRCLHLLRPNALALINLERIIPITVSSLGRRYPDDDDFRAALAESTAHAVCIDGPGIARGLGHLKVANSVLIGALSRLLEDQAVTGSPLSEPLWLDVMARQVPPTSAEINRQAFLAGRSAVLVPA